MDQGTSPVESEAYATLRGIMIEQQLRRRGIKDERVLQAMARVPREQFVSEAWKARAYEDEPVPIGEDQTISQPYIVAWMVAALRLNGTERVLEIGTGCGYQAAVLSCVAAEVFTVEFLPGLAGAAEDRLRQLGFSNVHVFCGDGTLGLLNFAPFDAIIVAAAAPAIPAPLITQLAEGGGLVAPVGSANQQEILVATKKNGGLEIVKSGGCRFVPLRGVHGWKKGEAE